MRKVKIIAGIILGIIFLVSSVITYIYRDVNIDDANIVQKTSAFIVMIFVLGLLLRGFYWVFFGGKK